MTTPTPSPPAIAGAWREHAEELAEWADRLLVNRRDACIRYVDPRRRGHVKHRNYTCKKGVTRRALADHFACRGEDATRGLHSTRVGEDGACTSRWVGVDIDRHDDSADAAATLRAAMAVHDAAAALGFRPLLTDSNGWGGYHALIIFDAPAPTADAHALGRWLVRGWESWGLPAAPEVFPKQAAIRPNGYGNGLRLPGRHHTRDHWSRAWDGSSWLEGEDAVRFILGIEGRAVSLIPAEAIDSSLAN